MSTYNSYNSIESSIKSILNQSYEEFEFLIIDDYSDDKTLEILKDYESIDQRIKVYKNVQNLGLTKSLNFLIRKSSMEFIARQDADDLSLGDRLETQINFLLNSKNKIVTSRAINMQTKKNRPKLSHHFPQSFIVNYKNPFIHGTLMIQKKMMYEFGLYDESFYYSQDYKLFYDISMSGINIPILSKPLYVLNTKNNISTNNRKEQKYYSECVKRKLVPNI
tara:strand:- start:1695 stop:2357 length:663 start_codon:yes stop_codon:yes gene_type:complete